MSPIGKNGLELRAGLSGDVDPCRFSFQDLDPAFQRGDDEPLRITLLSLEVEPVAGMNDLFDCVLIDQWGEDVLGGCGLARHPRKTTRCIIRDADDASPILDPTAERFEFRILGRHSPGATVRFALTYVATGDADPDDEVH